MENARGKVLAWIAGIAGTLLAGILLSDKNDNPLILVFGAALLELLGRVASWVWSVVTWDTGMPLGAMAILLATAMAFGAWLKSPPSVPEPKIDPRPMREANELTDAEISVLKLLAKQGTAWHSFSDIHYSGSLNDLVVEKALRGLLEETNFLLRRPDPYEGYRVRLSESGAELALSRGWAETQRPRW